MGDRDNMTGTAERTRPPEDRTGAVCGLLRAELERLRQDVEQHLRTIAELTDRAAGAAPRPQPQAAGPEIAELKHRHAVALQLAAVGHVSRTQGPAEGLPPLEDQIAMLGGTGLFDPEWYQKTYPDVQKSGLAPQEHYVRVGAFEGHDPGPYFSTMAYYLANSDVAAGGWPALVHYVERGRREGRPIA